MIAPNLSLYILQLDTCIHRRPATLKIDVLHVPRSASHRSRATPGVANMHEIYKLCTRYISFSIMCTSYIIYLVCIFSRVIHPCMPAIWRIYHGCQCIRAAAQHSQSNCKAQLTLMNCRPMAAPACILLSGSSQHICAADPQTSFLQRPGRMHVPGWCMRYILTSYAPYAQRFC